jgi:hypothetical protein
LVDVVFPNEAVELVNEQAVIILCHG